MTNDSVTVVGHDDVLPPEAIDDVPDSNGGIGPVDSSDPRKY